VALAPNKTKVVCTIGPASESPEILRHMLQAGLHVARLNFSHGDFAWHRSAIDHLRRAAVAASQRVTIMADLPGPKIRVGQLAAEPIELKQGNAFTLTTDKILYKIYAESLLEEAQTTVNDALAAAPQYPAQQTTNEASEEWRNEGSPN
jgi:pyruvate kinase